MKNCCSGVKAVEHGRRPALACALERPIRDLGAGEVADRFSEHQLAVVVDARLDE
jgi:hypothetical protein